MEKIDLRGKVCPYPIIAVNKKLRELKKGSKLEIIVTDCDATKSIPKQADRFGAKVEKIINLNDEWRIIIKVKKWVVS